HVNIQAKDWNGMTPLHSTRSEVERRFGKPLRSTPYGSYYSFADEIVVFEFQRETCEGDLGRFGIGWNVPFDTVTEIGVIPKRVYQKEKFVIGTDFKMERFDAVVYYTNEKLGLSVETFNGTVTLLSHSPTEKEAELECPRAEKCCIDFY